MATCDLNALKVSVNSANSKLTTAQKGFDDATQKYNDCLPPAKKAENAMAAAKDAIASIEKESGELTHMNEFLLKQLGKESEAYSTYSDLADIVKEESEKLKAEIGDLKSQIRTERRKFLDAAPSVSPAVGGLYYTKVPDNQVIIAFLVCFGAFLIAVSFLIYLNLIPLEYFMKMTVPERFKMIGVVVVGSLVFMYAGFYLFT